MLLGNYTNVHYQSLLEKLDTHKVTQRATDDAANQNELDEDFIYMHNGKKLLFRTFNKTTFECPLCKERYSRIVTHISNRNCEISVLKIDIIEFKQQINSFKEGFRLEMKKRWLKR